MPKKKIINYKTVLSFEDGHIVDEDFIKMVNAILYENIGQSLSGYIDLDDTREETDEEYQLRMQVEISSCRRNIAAHERNAQTFRDQLRLLENDDR